MENSSHISDSPSLKIYRFGNCYLNPAERKVFKDREQLEIVAKAFDILQLLVERQGEVVTKDEILENVWEGSFVEEGNLTVYVSKLRRMLKADKSEPYIETVSGAGYRFVAAVSEIDENELKTHLSFGNSHSAIVSSNSNSIAVLPLKNENGDEEIDYLTDGITENIINNLSYRPNLRVIARNTVFRYKDEVVDFQKVGKELDVQNILTGRVRIIRNKLTISVELINTKDGSQIWGTQINQPFEDIFEVQDKITQTISENLEIRIGVNDENLGTQTITNNLESYKFYLKGRYFLDKKTKTAVIKAIECFENSAFHDPTNAYSYIEMARGYQLLYATDQITHATTINKISTLLEKAKKINQSISELHVSNGFVNLFLEFDLREAEINFKKALKLNPNSLSAHGYYSKLLVYCGKFTQAFTHLSHVTSIDPISLTNSKKIAKAYYCMEQYENCLTKSKECHELEPNDFETLLILGCTLTELKRHDEAIQTIQKSIDLEHYSESQASLACAFARADKITESKTVLTQLEFESKTRSVAPYHIGHIHAALGNIDMAFICLEQALEEKYSDLIALKVDPRYKPIRDDPRFNQMLKKIGLPID